MFSQQLSKPRPLGRVILLFITTLIIYSGWYKWNVQEELRRYKGYGWGWSGMLCLLPLVLGVAILQALWILKPNVSEWLGWSSLVGVIWIYIVQFRLYRTVNALYRRHGLQEPSRVW